MTPIFNLKDNEVCCAESIYLASGVDYAATSFETPFVNKTSPRTVCFFIFIYNNTYDIPQQELLSIGTFNITFAYNYTTKDLYLCIRKSTTALFETTIKYYHNTWISLCFVICIEHFIIMESMGPSIIKSLPTDTNIFNFNDTLKILANYKGPIIAFKDLLIFPREINQTVQMLVHWGNM